MVPAPVIDTATLRKIALKIRIAVVESLAEAGSGHLGGSLGLADVFTALYFNWLRHDPARPEWEERDRLILSIGHLAPLLYATLAHAGYFPLEELRSLRRIGSRLQGHPGRDHGLPGIELSAGSLGQGLSVSLGMALAARMDKRQHHVVCILGDGELQEGSVWEAIMAAAHHGASNLLAIVDRNGLQIDGPTETVMALEPLPVRFEAFGWKVMECNGHDIPQIISCLEATRQNSTAPVVILAHTKMGKGVSSIEGDYRWHGKAPSASQAIDFIRQLREACS